MQAVSHGRAPALDWRICSRACPKAALPALGHGRGASPSRRNESTAGVFSLTPEVIAEATVFLGATAAACVAATVVFVSSEVLLVGTAATTMAVDLFAVIVAVAVSVVTPFCP